MRVLLAALFVLAALAASALAAPSSLDGRIVGGWDAARGQFPFQVSAQYCRGVTCSHVCGGVILSNIWVLTAGHCITDVNGGRYVIVAGILDLNDTNPQRQEINVAFAIVHPGYNGEIGPHDLGLFRLEGPLTFNDQVLPADLPREDQVLGHEGTLSGWGVFINQGNFLSMPNRLQTVTVPVLPTIECSDALTDILAGQPHPLDLDNNLCTGPLNEAISICSGDSGGPLVQDERTLVGISSWGVIPCGTVGAPSVYVRINHYIEWISYYIYEPTRH